MPREDTQFKPGQSGNPKGRMLGSRNVKTVFEDGMKLLYKTAKDKDASIEDIMAVIAQKQLMSAMGQGKNAHNSAQFVFDRLYGKPKQAIDLDARSEMIIPDETMAAVEAMQQMWVGKPKTKKKAVKKKAVKKKAKKK